MKKGMNMKAKSLLRYREFAMGDQRYPSIKDSFEAEAYAGQDKIADYLRNGRVTLCATSASVDVLTGQQIDGRKCLMTDGEYSWNNTLAYYVEKYNLRLPTEFEEKVLSA